MKIQANKKALIRWKVYIDRARMYVGYLQFLMIGFMFLQSYDQTSWGKLIFENLFISTPIVFLLFIILSLLIGRMDTIFGFREEELKNASTSNPIMREMLTEIKALRKEVQELKEKH